MALINQAIANLFNGVSQQPPQLRLSSQCELSDNFYPTIATGNSKRPPTRFLAKLSTSLDATAYVSILNRDASERYALILRNGSIEVFDIFTGVKKTVNTPNGTSYLTCTDPIKDFSTVTVADHTFIVNKTKTVGYTSAKTAVKQKVGYVSFSYNGAGYTRTMSIVVKEGSTVLGSASYSGSDNSITAPISTLLSGLQASLGASFSVTRPFDSLVRIERLTGTADFNIYASDTYGSSTMKVVKDSVQLFSDLPLQVDDGCVTYITSTPEQQGKGYYVIYDASKKSYIECPAQDTYTTLDAATMPMKLVREADGSFTLQSITWVPRKVGDYSSNPWPTFVGRKINDVFFYRNRLGFLSDENVILSTAGDYYNFFAKTATAVVDTDPIDEAAANTKVSILRHAVPFNKVLLLFSDQTQFQLHAADLLTPKTVKADPVTEFISSPICRPVGAGSSLFFVSDKDKSTGVREYFVEQQAMSNDAADITAHVPSYVPTGVFKMTASTSEDVLCCLSKEERNALYIYKFYWGAEEKVQSAWFRFLLEPSDALMGAEFCGSSLYLVIKRSDGIYLEELSVEAGISDDGLPFQVLLDRKVSLTGTYSAASNATTWTLPWPADGDLKAVLGSGFGSRAGTSLMLTKDGGYYVSAKGDFSAAPVFVGVTYEARYRFSEQFIHDEKNQVIAAANVKIRRMHLTYSDTGYFRVEVTPPGRDTSTYAFTGKQLGIAGVTLGAPSLSGGHKLVPIKSSAKGVRIDLVNDSPFPCSFQSAEWEGEVVVQSRRG